MAVLSRCIAYNYVSIPLLYNTWLYDGRVLMSVLLTVMYPSLYFITLDYVMAVFSRPY